MVTGCGAAPPGTVTERLPSVIVLSAGRKMAAAAAEASGPSCSSAAAAAGAGAAGVSEWLVLRDGCMRCDADGLHSLSYHPALNAILAVTSRGTIKVIDGTSGATLQASALSGERGTPGGGWAGRGRSRVVGMLVEKASQPPGSASEGQRGAGGPGRPGSYGPGPSDSESSSDWGGELGLVRCELLFGPFASGPTWSCGRDEEALEVGAGEGQALAGLLDQVLGQLRAGPEGRVGRLGCGGRGGWPEARGGKLPSRLSCPLFSRSSGPLVVVRCRCGDLRGLSLRLEVGWSGDGDGEGSRRGKASCLNCASWTMVLAECKEG